LPRKKAPLTIHDIIAKHKAVYKNTAIFVIEGEYLKIKGANTYYCFGDGRKEIKITKEQIKEIQNGL
jgi:hypothetical protein